MNQRGAAGEEIEAEAGGVEIRNAQERKSLRPGLLPDLARCGATVVAMIRDGDLQRCSLPPRVEVALVDDAAIAQLHGDYLGDPSPTDVITFSYGEVGEILISVETAACQAEEFANPFDRELALYLVHGMLHLAGFEDRTGKGRGEMEALQERLLTAVGFGD